MPKIPSASSIKSVRKAPVPSRQEQQQSKESGGTSTQEASGSNSNASAAKAKGKATKESTCKQCKENPWVPPAHPGNFQHSTGVITVTSGQATVLDGINPPPPLKKEELDTLLHQWIYAANGRRAKLFVEKDVRELIVQRCTFVGVPAPPKTLRSLDTYGQAGPSVFIGRLSPDPAPDKPATLTELRANPESVQFRGKGAIIRCDYTPVEGDPPLDEIVWVGPIITREETGVTEADACMLYCLEKADLDPLRKPKCQNLFNIRSLAVRALEVHGGLNAHNQIIYSKRKEDKDILDKRYEEMGWCDGEPVRRFSTYLEQYLKDWPVHEMGSTDTEPPSEGTEKRVLQYAPIRKVNDGEMWSAEIHWTTKIRGETPDD